MMLISISEAAGIVSRTPVDSVSPVLSGVVAVVAVVAVVWGMFAHYDRRNEKRVLEESADRAKSERDIWKALKEEADKRHELELLVAREYMPSKSTVRAIADALIPIRQQHQHIEELMAAGFREVKGLINIQPSNGSG